jgi:hypothetical protein
MKGPAPIADSGLFQIAVLLHCLARHDPGPRRVREDVDEPHEGLLQTELDGIAIDDFHAIHRVKQILERIGLLGQEAVVGELDILGDQLTSVDGRPVLPADAFAQVKDHGPIVKLVPALGEVRLHDEAAGRDFGAHLVAHELGVDEA